MLEMTSGLSYEVLLTRNSSSSDWSRFSVNPRGYTGDPKYRFISFISSLIVLFAIVIIIKLLLT